jgi:Flp pilus assembly protein TadD
MVGNPIDVPTRHNLVGLLVEQGRLDEARILAAESAKATGDASFSDTGWLRGTPPPPAPPQPEGCGDEAGMRALFTDADYLTSRAVGLLKSQNLEMAGTLLKAALLVQPRHVRARVNLAQWHLMRSENAEARALLDGVLAEVPDHPTARKLYAYADGSVPLPKP